MQILLLTGAVTVVSLTFYCLAVIAKHRKEHKAFIEKMKKIHNLPCLAVLVINPIWLMLGVLFGLLVLRFCIFCKAEKDKEEKYLGQDFNQNDNE